METGRIDRNEKLPSLKLTVVQYGILLMMLALACRTVAASGAGRRQLSGARRAEPHPQRARPLPRAASSSTAKTASLSTTTPPFSCFLVREQNPNIDGDLPLIAQRPTWTWTNCAPPFAAIAPHPAISPFPSSRTITADETPSSKPTKTNCRSLRPSTKSDAFIPATAFASHIIGYVGEVSEDDLTNPRYALL